MLTPFSLILHLHTPLVRHGISDDPATQSHQKYVSSVVQPLLTSLEHLASKRASARLAIGLSGPLLSNLESSPEDSDLLRRFRLLEETGLIEIFTSPGTHAILPLLVTESARESQIQAGVATLVRATGRRPQGMWLAGHAYDCGLDHLLAAAGITWISTNVIDRCAESVVQTPGGVTMFGTPARLRPFLNLITNPNEQADHTLCLQTARCIVASVTSDPTFKAFPLGIVSPADCALATALLYEAVDHELDLVSPSEWLKDHTRPLVAQVCGRADHGAFIHPSHANVWARLHEAELHMLSIQHAAGISDSTVRKASEALMLAQSSDWLEQARHLDTGAYGLLRINEYLHYFKTIISGDLGLFSPFTLADKDPSGLINSTASHKPIRILMLAHEFPPDSGGLGRHVHDLGVELAQQGHCVHVITLPDDAVGPGMMHASGMTIHRIERPVSAPTYHQKAYLFNQAMITKAQEIAAEFGSFDVVHAHEWIVLQAGIAVKTKWGAKLVTTFHGTRHGHFPDGFAGPNVTDHLLTHQEEWLLAIAADATIAVSQATAQEVQESFANCPTVIYNGVFPPKPAPPPCFHAPYVLLIGRLAHQKGFDLAIRAFQQLPQHMHLVVAGKGRMEELLRRVARAYHLEDRVHFIGWVSGTEKDSWIQHARIGVVPSRVEPFGIVALEFMAAGVPTVVANAGGLTEIVRDGIDGLAIPSNDVENLAKAMQYLIDHPDDAARLGAAGLDSVAQRFAWNSIAEQTAKVYRDLLEFSMYRTFFI